MKWNICYEMDEYIWDSAEWKLLFTRKEMRAERPESMPGPFEQSDDGEPSGKVEQSSKSQVTAEYDSESRPLSFRAAKRLWDDNANITIACW